MRVPVQRGEEEQLARERGEDDAAVAYAQLGEAQEVAAERPRDGDPYERGDDEDVRPQGMQPPAAGRLSEIHVPTLIIVGGQDVEIILTIADTLEKGIAGAKKVVIPGTAHHPNLEKPEEFNRVVIDFLEHLSSSR